MKFNKSLVTAAILAVGSLAAVSANAASPATGSFNVKLQVNAVCTVDAAIGTQDIDFGTVDAGVAPNANVTSTTALSVKCSTGSPYTIALSPTGAATDGTGTMTNGTDTIAYKLNSDAAGTIAWGNVTTGAGANVVTGTGTGTTSAISHPVYATVTGSTDVRTGAYIDLVNVAVTY